jgi:hypothetical protein
MSVWSTFGAGTRALIVGAGGLAAVAVGYVGWQVSHRAQAPDVANSGVSEPTPTATAPEAEVAAATDPEAAADPASEAPSESQAEATPAPVVVPEAVAAADPPVEQPVAAPEALPIAPPRFDTWRVEPDGAAVVSGRAAPGARVAVVVDGAPVAEVLAGPSGEFAALFTLPPNDKPGLMTLTMTPPDGAEVGSEEMVALGAIKGPEVVAALPEATPPAADAVASVSEPTPPPAILLTEDGAVVLQDDASALSATDAAVVVDTISYSPEGAVQLGGRGTSGAMVRVYLDNALQRMTAVSPQGQWLATLADTPPGIYTLRVDQVDANGKVTSRFETPFKRETLEALAAVADAPVVPPTAPVAEDMAEEGAEPPPAAADEPVALAQPDATPEATPEPEATATLTPDATPDVVVAEPTKAAPVTITVQPGFTLWGIAQQSYGDGVMYVQVFEANKDKIRDPDLIYPGQVFAMPEGEADGG